MPLLISFHGHTSNSAAHALETGWGDFAERERFIVAFPNTPIEAWLWGPNSTDVSIARDLVADVRASYCIDPARVYASGYSNGAQMAQRLGCDAADLFASVTEYAGGSPGDLTCHPSRPIAVGMFHGDADGTVSISDGRASRDERVARLHCSTPPATTVLADGIEQIYPCPDDTEVLWREYSGQHHPWPPALWATTCDSACGPSTPRTRSPAPREAAAATRRRLDVRPSGEPPTPPSSPPPRTRCAASNGSAAPRTSPSPAPPAPARRTSLKPSFMP